MKKKKVINKISLRSLFLGLQNEMSQELETLRKNVNHEPTKGEGSESIWIKFLRDYLPKRYSVAKAKIVDYKGNTSDQIDVVIYDTQYTPFVLNKKNVKYIPAESIYAIFEAKQDVNKSQLVYAGKKIESVRNLLRTTAPVIDRGEIKPAPQLFKIIGGFLCLESRWSGSISTNKAFREQFNSSTELSFIDIGCVLNDKSFKIDMDITDALNPKVIFNFSTKEETLIYFFLKLVTELQKLGTVRPIDLSKYIDHLNSQ
jgi:hypothetical protein